MVEETTEADRFVLLRDFEDAYDKFSLGTQGSMDEIADLVRGPMDRAIRDTVNEFEAFTLADIRSLTAEETSGGTYVVTVDGGTYFAEHDQSFEVTRACYKLEHAISGPYFRLGRGTGRLFVEQALKLRRDYLQEGYNKPILLCDDGIGTGNTIKYIMNICDQVGLDVSEIQVLVNPNEHESLDGVDVETLLDIEPPFIWLSERDLYWGLPRGGLSFTKEDEFQPVYGIPYTIDARMVNARIGLKDEAAADFREKCLELNKTFWEYLEDLNDRDLTFRSCPRLSYFGTKLNIEQMRIVEFLERINRTDFRLEDFR